MIATYSALDYPRQTTQTALTNSTLQNRTHSMKVSHSNVDMIRTGPLPGAVHREKGQRLEPLGRLAAGLAAAMVSYLELAGEEAQLPPLSWTVEFDSIGFHGQTFENCCSITGWCDVEGPEGVRLCQQWVAVADYFDSYWAEPETDDSGSWKASGYLSGVDVSVACIAEPEARALADQKHLTDPATRHG